MTCKMSDSQPPQEDPNPNQENATSKPESPNDHKTAKVEQEHEQCSPTVGGKEVEQELVHQVQAEPMLDHQETVITEGYTEEEEEGLEESGGQSLGERVLDQRGVQACSVVVVAKEERKSEVGKACKLELRAAPEEGHPAQGQGHEQVVPNAEVHVPSSQLQHHPLASPPVHVQQYQVQHQHQHVSMPSGASLATNTPTVIRQLTPEGNIIVRSSGLSHLQQQQQQQPIEQPHVVQLHAGPSQQHLHQLQHQHQHQQQPPHPPQMQIQYLSPYEPTFFNDGEEQVIYYTPLPDQGQNEQLYHPASTQMYNGVPEQQFIEIPSRGGVYEQSQDMDLHAYPPNFQSIMVQHDDHTMGRQCVNCGRPNAPLNDARGHPLCHSCCELQVESNANIYIRQPAPLPGRQSKKGNSSKVAKATSQNRRTGVECANCKTSKTTLWRRNNQGEPVCNSCGLYFKLHQVNRPVSMKKDTIQTRKRKPKSGVVGTSHTITSAHLQQHQQRLNGMTPSNMAHHPLFHPSMPSTSGYQPAGDIHYADQPQFMSYDILRSNAQMPEALQPVHVYREPANVAAAAAAAAANGHPQQHGHEEQATVITSTSTVAGAYHNPDHEQDEDEDSHNNNM